LKSCSSDAFSSPFFFRLGWGPPLQDLSPPPPPAPPPAPAPPPPPRAPRPSGGGGRRHHQTPPQWGRPGPRLRIQRLRRAGPACSRGARPRLGHPAAPAT